MKGPELIWPQAAAAAAAAAAAEAAAKLAAALVRREWGVQGLVFP